MGSFKGMRLPGQAKILWLLQLCSESCPQGLSEKKNIGMRTVGGGQHIARRIISRFGGPSRQDLKHKVYARPRRTESGLSRRADSTMLATGQSNIASQSAFNEAKSRWQNVAKTSRSASRLCKLCDEADTMTVPQTQYAKVLHAFRSYKLPFEYPTFYHHIW